ncbi:MAG: cysteine desulfurase family protein [Rickettsiaceae bacterium]|nr:cysteine desulfurase family protein [Rickettsiaceae bacterium]
MIYLDHNSTSIMHNDLKNQIIEFFGEPLNPSSIHTYGRRARNLLEESREYIASALYANLGRNGYKIIFTSGATEANNLALKGFDAKHILYDPTSHASVIEALRSFENKHKLTVNKQGQLDLAQLEELLFTYKDTKILVTVIAANNETGVIQPVSDISKICKKYSAYLHLDSAQTFGKIEFNITSLDVDLASISAHKIGGLTGTGALIVKYDIKLTPLIEGGGQEKSERSGTENLIGAISFGLAAKKIHENIGEFNTRILKLRDFLEENINLSPNAIIIGQNTSRLPNTSLISTIGVDSNLQLIKFDQSGICVSNGAACSSGTVKRSHVIKEMGYDEEVAKSAVRVSFGLNNTIDDAKKFLNAWHETEEKMLKQKFRVA